MADDLASDAEAARRLMQRATKTSLATLMAGRPYASLALVACDADGSPLLMLSDLAQHSRNLAVDSRVSLLFDGTEGLADPLTGVRLTVQGAATPCRDPDARALYLERHPSAAAYADFADFQIYRVDVTRAHLIAGFGLIAWVEGDALRSQSPGRSIS